MTIQPTALLPGERLLLEANQGILVLTSHRIRLTQKRGGGQKVVSITLASVASCGLVSVSYPALLGLAALGLILGVILFSNNAGGVGVLFVFGAIVSVLAYLLGRRTVLEIASAASKIEVEAKGMSPESLLHFIDTLERAKLSR